jgi:hypothetical protein
LGGAGGGGGLNGPTSGYGLCMYTRWLEWRVEVLTLGDTADGSGRQEWSFSEWIPDSSGGGKGDLPCML